MAPVSPADVQRIAAIGSPVLRNLEITYAYSLLAADVAARSGQGANWCTFATWASRQAGATIRGEDTLDLLMDRLGGGALLHPLRTFGRWLLRRGLLDRASRVGRLMARLHTPFDAVELASDAVARGNRKVFEEIGYEFARWLAAEDSRRLRREPARRRPARRAAAAEGRVHPLLRAVARAAAAVLRQPADRAARADPLAAGDLRGARRPVHHLRGAGRRLFPRRGPRIQRAAALVVGPVQGKLAELSRELITHALMTLSVPGRILLLGSDLLDPYPEVLRALTDAELSALVASFEPAGVDHSGAIDWSDLHQRMHYIIHLFRAFHELHDLYDAPFSPAAVEQFLAGAIPDGDL